MRGCGIMQGQRGIRRKRPSKRKKKKWQNDTPVELGINNQNCRGTRKKERLNSPPSSNTFVVKKRRIHSLVLGKQPGGNRQRNSPTAARKRRATQCRGNISKESASISIIAGGAVKGGSRFCEDFGERKGEWGEK